MDKQTNRERQIPLELIGVCKATWYTSEYAESIIHGTEQQVYLTALMWIRQTMRLRQPTQCDMIVATYLYNMFKLSLYMYILYGWDSYISLNYTRLEQSMTINLDLSLGVINNQYQEPQHHYTFNIFIHLL